MSAFFADLKYGVRMLVKHPGLTAISVLALGLGLGLTTTMWSINYGALMRGLPFPGGDDILWVGRANPERDIERTGYGSLLDFEAIKEGQTAFSTLAFYAGGTVNVSGGEGRPERYQGGMFSAEVFPLVGVRPHLGRWFTAEETEFGGPRAIILGYEMWQNRFAGNPNVLGTTLRANGEVVTVVGVMPEGFRFPIREDLWLPYRIDRGAENRETNAHGGGALAKLKPGVTVDQAMQQLAGIEDRLAREFPRSNAGMKPYIKPFTFTIIGREPLIMLWTMMGAVFGVLLIACSNVANLLLARAAMRTKEVAVRTALGASRWRIMSQLLAEALVLSAAGAVVGIAIAAYGTAWFNDKLAGTRPPFWIKIGVDPAILMFVLGITVLAAILSGVLPALQATGSRIHEVLKDESRGASSMRLGKVSRSLVVVEIALSCGLLIASGFMIQSVVQRSTYNYGIRTDDVFTARVALFASTYPDGNARRQFWNSVTERLEALPGQRGVSLVTSLPGVGSGTDYFAIEGTTYETARDYPEVRSPVVSRGFFGQFELRPIEGRLFDATDLPRSQPVILLSHSFAQKYFPGQSPLGKRIQLGGKDSEQPWRTIVGVVPDVWWQGNDDDTPEALYLPMEQGSWEFMWLTVRAAGGDPMAFADQVRAAVASVDSDQPIYFADTLDNRIAQSGWFYDVFGRLFGAFGVAALLLATVGVYGVMSFAVTRRTQEVGVRMALGAGGRDVLGMFLRQGAIQIGIGAVIGLVLAIFISMGIKAVLFQVDVRNPLMFIAVMGALVLTGIIAVLIPARRATKVDPMIALRYS